MQSNGYLFDDLQCGVPAATLDSANIGPIQTSLVGKSFL